MLHIALLRGINVGGHNKLPMKTLASMFEDAGCGAVRTYIQSGNVVFEADVKLARQIPDLIEKALAREVGLGVPVVTRTADELAAVVRDNPFLRAGVDEKQLHVAFLAEKPTKKQIASLDPDRSPPDEFTVRGREVYLRCPNGMARTKLTNAYFDSKLDTVSTMRNWRSVLTLLEMATD